MLLVNKRFLHFFKKTSIFNLLDYFLAKFSYQPHQLYTICLKFVVSFAHTRVNGLVIKIAYDFQYRKYYKFNCRSK